MRKLEPKVIEASLAHSATAEGAKGVSYPISIGIDMQPELLEALKKEGVSKIAIISDEKVGGLWGSEIVTLLTDAEMSAELFTFAAGEKNKTQETATTLSHSLLEKHYGRDTLILALGGGVVGDVAGYVASTYMRGIPYINMPTTLLSMVDSSVGGKVGVDTPYGKNTVGAFWQPRAVIADLRFLEKLPAKEVTSGLLEAIKTFFTSDKSALEVVDKLSIQDPLSTLPELQEIVVRSVAFKAGVVSRDEREENERRILNFGHTIGHAIEFLSEYSMPHGFAVGYGILVETRMAEILGVLSSEDCAAVHAYLARFGIEPSGLADFPADKVLEIARGDKKSRGGAAYYVLLKAIGEVQTDGGEYAHKVEDAVALQAFASLASA